MNLKERLAKGHSFEIRVIHRGQFWGGWDGEFSPDSSQYQSIKNELLASWKLSIDSKKLKNIKVELTSYKNNEDYYDDGQDYSELGKSEEIVLRNDDKKIKKEYDLEVIDILNINLFQKTLKAKNLLKADVPVKFEDFLAQGEKLIENDQVNDIWSDYFMEYGDCTFNLFMEVVEIKTKVGRKTYTELFLGTGVFNIGFFKFFSCLKLKQKLRFYHKPPLLAKIKLRIKGMKPLISCAVPIIEAYNLNNMIKYFDRDYVGKGDLDSDAGLNDVLYYLPTLGGKLYLINLGDIQEIHTSNTENDGDFKLVRPYKFRFIVDENNGSMPKCDGQLYMPNDVRILYKDTNHFVDMDIEQYMSGFEFAFRHYAKGNDFLITELWCPSFQEFSSRDGGNISIALRNISFLAIKAPDLNSFLNPIFGILGRHYENYWSANDDKSEMLYLNSKNQVVDKNGKIKRKRV
jgi:hypothetical protein